MKKMLIGGCIFVVNLMGQGVPLGSVGPFNVNPWTLNNNQLGISGPSTASVSTPTFTNPLINGSIILVGTAAAVTSFSGQLVNDTAGNAYVLIQSGNQFGPGTPNLWCAPNIHTTVNNVVTLSLVGGFSFPSKVIQAIEIVSANGAIGCTTSRDDIGMTQTNSTSGSNNAFCGGGGKLNLSHANDFVYQWVNYNGGATFSAGTSPFMFTLLGTDNTVQGTLGEYFIEPTIFGANFIGTTTTSVTSQTYQSFCVAYHP